mmetsp:Transcript_5745/g.6593  ORF Transcript_5745/g.6593 Transcript_5745/m.6593 type:complete len:148 (+) Transcript_5745:223-666(+)|eukprot:CAMPEP_0197862780 /NCGR_PEP_ID=MMETSP1438-20131217/39772_1 /TAXON_ID=1461541 /ORGANISM="Pterosperma sp., Strain CCMP1384" /LENGTH=147 /DNA_ID=CAMNT_0043480443 /DNA_START=212 /DNA_END=655 /DNA_ORIENTATION=-
MAADPFPDACGMHKLKSPHGDFKLTTIAHGQKVRDPMTGSVLANAYSDKKDADIERFAVKQNQNRSRKFWVKDDPELLIHHIRNTNHCNNNTNERRLGLADQITAVDHRLIKVKAKTSDFSDTAGSSQMVSFSGVVQQQEVDKTFVS